MNAPEIKAVIFDMDGCLVDSEPLSLVAIAAEMRDAGLTQTTPDDVRENYLGISIAKICSDVGQKLGTSEPGNFVENVETRLFKAYETDLYRISGVFALLAELQQAGIPVAIASGSSTRRLAKTLEISELAAHFTGNAFSADQVTHGKPAPDLFIHAADHLGVAAIHCAVLEDSPHGIQGARAAGMHAIGFVGGSHLSGHRQSHTAILEQAGAVKVIANLAEAFHALVPHQRGG